MVAPRAVSSPNAFDLVMTSAGATLVYGAAYGDGAGIRMLPLTTQGDAAAGERIVLQGGAAAGDTVELAAASGGGRIGVGWLERTPRGSRVRVTYGEDSGEAFAPPRTLGNSDAPARGPRGQVALAASNGGRVQVLWRGARTACESGSSAQCVPVSVDRVAPVASERSGVALVLPSPCARTVTGFAIAADGTWYYGVCDNSVTTAYAIQFEPQYAHAERLLEGCDPIGISSFAEGVALTGSCEGTVRGTRLESGGRALSHFDSPPLIGCVEGGPVIEIGTVVSPLGAPRDGLAALLPSQFAPPGSRAVWTGDAVLVAQSQGGEVVLRRYDCQGGVFRRNDHE